MLQLPLLAAAAFNLVCTGTVRTGINEPKPFSQTLRVDLEAGRWCTNECKDLQPIAKVSPAVLTLADKNTEGATDRRTERTIVNRESGDYFSKVENLSRITGLISIAWTGKCERAAFTGFPEVKTKF